MQIWPFFVFGVNLTNFKKNLYNNKNPIFFYVERFGKQRFLSELLVYLKNFPPGLLLLFLTMV